MNYSVVLGGAALLFFSVAGTSPRAAYLPISTAQANADRGAELDSLLAADRAFSAAAAKTDVISGLSAMFAPNVTMPVQGTLWANGIDEVTQNLRTNADNAKSHAEWTPIRGGISADGQQGFTFGFMTVHKPDNTTVPIKYMSYWVKGANGWRVAAYKRSRRPDSTVAMTPMPPSLPSRTASITTDAKTLNENANGLKQAEQNFSDEAQKIGLGSAFAKNGSADAVNMGSGAGYILGAAAIAVDVSGPTPAPGSPYVWKADRVIVASSGDLGVTLGVIHEHANPTAAGSPFFTIWRRASPTAPWSYIAE